MNEMDMLIAAANRILEGDDSMNAARDLEGVVADGFREDDRVQDLAYVLALYQPGGVSPYVDASELRKTITRTLSRLL